MFIVGMIYRHLDTLLSKRQQPGSITSYVFAISHVELSVLGLYLIRGSVLSSFAYTVGVGATLVTINVVERCIRGACLPVDRPNRAALGIVRPRHCVRPCNQ